MEPKAYFKKIGSGPNLIFLHGWEQNKKGWGQVVELLSRDFTCWLVDLPYFGENFTELKDKSPIGYSKWVDKFILQNKLKNVSLLGHSFGGKIAIICASENKSVKKIVVYGTPAFRPKDKIQLSSFANAFGIKNIPVVSNLLRSADYKNAAGQKRDVFTQTVNFDLLPFIKRASKKTLLVWGEDDKEVDIAVAQKLKTLIKDSQLYVIPSTSHFAHLEKPLLFAAVVKKFLKNE